MKQHAGVVPFLAGGIALGALLGVLVSHGARTSDAASALETGQRATVDTEAVAEALEQQGLQLRSMQHRIDVRDHSKPANTAPPPQADDPLQASPEQHERERRQLLQRWEDDQAHYQAEPVDPTFAAPAGAVLERAFAELGSELGFALVATECRRRGCKAVVEWPDYQAASANFRQTMIVPQQLNCATKTLLPEPADPKAPYRSTVLYGGCTLDTTPDG